MSDANRTAIGFCREVSFNTPPIALSAESVTGTNTLHSLRFTRDGLLAEKETIISEEIRSNRQVAELIRVGLKNSGSIDAEFSMKDYDDLIESALQSDYGTTVAVTVNFNGPAGTITATSGSPFRAIKNAKHIKISNAVTSANNGIKVVTAMTDTVISVGAGQITGTDAGDAISVQVTFVAEVTEYLSTVDVTLGTTFTLTSGNFSATVRAARYIKLTSSLEASAKIVKVVSCSATVLVTSGFAFTNGTNEDLTVEVNYTREGSNYMTYLIQKTYADITRYLAFTGMGIDTYDFKMEAKNKVMQAFGFLGCQGLSRSASVNVASVNASTNGIVNTSSMIGSLLKDGSAMVNPVMAVNFQVKNNLREKPYIGSLVTQQHGVGYSEVSGDLRVYFTSADMLTAFLAHTPFALEFPITDAAGNVMNVYLPSVQTSSGSPENTGINTDVMQTVNFRALPHATLGYQIQIDRLLA